MSSAFAGASTLAVFVTSFFGSSLFTSSTFAESSFVGLFGGASILEGVVTSFSGFSAGFSSICGIGGLERGAPRAGRGLALKVPN